MAASAAAAAVVGTDLGVVIPAVVSLFPGQRGVGCIKESPRNAGLKGERGIGP